LLFFSFRPIRHGFADCRGCLRPCFFLPKEQIEAQKNQNNCKSAEGNQEVAIGRCAVNLGILEAGDMNDAAVRGVGDRGAHADSNKLMHAEEK
jgi:hypothetical protein